jgi:integrase
MRVAKMGHTQTVTKKDANGRVISLYQRVRIVVPSEVSASLPAPYTGQKALTKKYSCDREAAEWTARFLSMIEAASGKSTAFQDLVRLGNLDLAEQIRLGPDIFRRFFASLDLPVPASEKPVEPVSFDSMIEKWATTTNAPKDGRQSMTTKCERFAAWLGHHNMAEVEFDHGRDYRDFLIEEGQLSPRSILNHLKRIKALFAYTYDNKHITIRQNPMRDVKYSVDDGDGRDDFTPDERRRILLAAREAKPVIYWCNWLASFHGTRVGEITDIDTRDFVEIDGIWVMQIRKKHRSKNQRLKTKESIRSVPLHNAVLREGFIAYVQSLGDGPLFREVQLDGYGKRMAPASKEISGWLRHTVGITDPRKPFYSHRHTAISYLRNMRLPDGSPAVKEDIERYLTGHAGSGAHAGYGKRWIETLKAAIEIIPNPLS